MIAANNISREEEIETNGVGYRSSRPEGLSC